jgi:zinc transport system substrate-binding protein
MAAHEHHDQEKHHNHGILNPHIWLSPPLVKIQAHTILSALQQVDPSHGTFYQTNYHEFISRIHELDGQLKTLFAEKQGLQFLVFHPAWGYFAHAYGIEQVSIEIEGKDPKPARLKELIEYAREKHIKMIFVQPQFSTKSADLVAKEIGGQVAVADPLAEDWMANLREIANKFEAALK